MKQSDLEFYENIYGNKLLDVKVEYDVINRTHSAGYCSGADASDKDDSDYEQLGKCNDIISILEDDVNEYFTESDNETLHPILYKFHQRLSSDCGDNGGSKYCSGYGVWKRAKNVEFEKY